MVTETASQIHSPGEAPWGVGQPSPPGGPPARAFPTQEEIEQVRLRKLRALLEAIFPANPFYARKLAAGGAALAPASLEDYKRLIPITTRHELVRDRLANPPYGTNLTFPLEAYVRCHQTSGTTTVPIRWLDTAESWDHIVDNWVQIFDAAGVTRRDRFFFAFSFGPFLGFWSARAGVHGWVFFFSRGGSLSTQARLQPTRKNGTPALCCTPTYAQPLGEFAREGKWNWSG